MVAGLAACVERVTRQDARDLRLDGSLLNLIGKGFLHNIYFVGALDQNDRSRVAGTPLFEEFVKDGNGIHLGGSVSSQQLFDFSGMPFALQGKPEKPGVGLVPPRDGEPYRRVILPQVKG